MAKNAPTIRNIFFSFSEIDLGVVFKSLPCKYCQKTDDNLQFQKRFLELWE